MNHKERMRYNHDKTKHNKYIIEMFPCCSGTHKSGDIITNWQTFLTIHVPVPCIIHGLVQYFGISIALEVKILPSCNKPSIDGQQTHNKYTVQMSPCCSGTHKSGAIATNWQTFLTLQVPAPYIVDGLVQDCGISTELEVKILPSCDKPSIYGHQTLQKYKNKQKQNCN